MGKHIIKSGVYQITNIINGNFYIGSSKNIGDRWRGWRRVFKKPMKTRSKIWNAVQKYGVENFSFSILEECDPLKSILVAREQHYIDVLNPLYNIRKLAGYGGNKGGKPFDRPTDRYITANGETKKLNQWAKELGVKHSAIRYRLDQKGWSPEDAVSVPKPQRPNGKLSDQQVIEIRTLYNTTDASLNSLAKEFLVSKRTILNIIHNKIFTDLKTTEPKKFQFKLTPEQIKEIKEIRATTNKGMKEIAQQFSISKSYVHLILKAA